MPVLLAEGSPGSANSGRNHTLVAGKGAVRVVLWVFLGGIREVEIFVKLVLLQLLHLLKLQEEPRALVFLLLRSMKRSPVEANGYF